MSVETDRCTALTCPAHGELNRLRAKVKAVEALAEQWDAIPDYTASDYDQGRVDQRHMATIELLEALG